MSESNSKDQKVENNLEENVETFVILVKRFIPLLVVLLLVVFLWLFFKYGCENNKSLSPMNRVVNSDDSTTTTKDSAISDTNTIFN